MSPITLIRSAKSWRRPLVVGALLAGCALPVAVHHAGLADAHSMAAAVVCLAVVSTVAVFRTAPALVSRPGWPPALISAVRRAAWPLPAPPAAAARDGPPELQVFLS